MNFFDHLSKHLDKVGSAERFNSNKVASGFALFLASYGNPCLTLTTVISSDFLKRLSSSSPSCESTSVSRLAGCSPGGEYLGKKI